MILCIGREFGNGGHEIGKQLAENMAYFFYDQELVTAAMKRCGSINVDELKKADEKNESMVSWHLV